MHTCSRCRISSTLRLKQYSIPHHRTVLLRFPWFLHARCRIAGVNGTLDFFSSTMRLLARMEFVLIICDGIFSRHLEWDLCSAYLACLVCVEMSSSWRDSGAKCQVFSSRRCLEIFSSNLLSYFVSHHSIRWCWGAMKNNVGLGKKPNKQYLILGSRWRTYNDPWQASRKRGWW